MEGGPWGRGQPEMEQYEDEKMGLGADHQWLQLVDGEQEPRAVAVSVHYVLDEDEHAFVAGGWLYRR